MTRKQNGEITTDKHNDGAMPEDSGHPPHLFYPMTPRREIDWEKVDLRWMVDHSENQTRLYRFFVGVRDFLSRLKRRQPKAQAPYSALIDQLPEPAAWPTDDEISKIAKELSERRAVEAAVRHELEQCADDELEAIVEPRFMFRDSEPEFRARVTTRQRVAQELLDERAKTAGTYRPDPHAAYSHQATPLMAGTVIDLLAVC